MARQKIDIITCDRCERRLEEAAVRKIQFSILYHDPGIAEKVAERDNATFREIEKLSATKTPYIQPQPAPAPTAYHEVCDRCDKLLSRLAADAATPSKPGRPRKEEKEDE